MRASTNVVGCLALMLGSFAVTARADLVENSAFAFGALGFDLRGFHNPLSDGIEISGVNRFTGDTLDLGAWELTLSGPLSFQISTGGRVLSQFDLSFGTNTSRGGNVAPLNYDLVFDVGAQRREVSGALLIDAGFSHKGLGFYDISLQVSSRQDVSDEGVFRTAEEELDFDIGPIHVRGNVFADALAIITEPFFEATGQVNIFETFSGRAQLLSLLSGSSDAALRLLAEGPDAIEDRIADFLDFDGRRLTLSLVDPNAPNSLRSLLSGSAVPEPTVLVLMLLGIPALLRRRRSR